MTNKNFQPSGHNEGDITIVKIGDCEFTTVIVNGSQCFQADTVTVALHDAMVAGHRAWWNTNNDAPELYSLNTLTVEYSNGKHTLDSMLTFYINIGYNVRELTYLSVFCGLDIRNPLWEENDYKVLPNPVWGELMGLIGHEYEHNGNESVRYIFDAVAEGKWGTDREGQFIARTDTIDRVVKAYLKKHGIEPWNIQVKPETTTELKAFVKQLNR